MNTTVRKSQIATMKSFDNLFIEMSDKHCNQKCKNCYIDFPQFRKVENFIKIETIEKALKELENTNIKCIYLTGAEPMTHPDFNSILRLCLKKTSVCICTNGSLINEKKARFLSKVEDESKNEILFRISLDHYDEVKNDDTRYRGAYRQAVFAIRHLLKYNFLTVISVTNFYKEDEKHLRQEINKIFSDSTTMQPKIIINKWHDKNSQMKDIITEQKWNRLECEYGRTLSAKGVYSCPFLAGDYRGRCGSDFYDYSDRLPLETNFCETCIENPHQMFGLNFDNLISI